MSKIAKSTGSLVKKAVSSDTAKDLTKTLGSSLAEAGSSLAADVILGKDAEQVKTNAQGRLQKAREDIAKIVRQSGESSKKKKKSAKKTKLDQLSDEDLEEDEIPVKARKKRINVSKVKKKKPRGYYSVFDD